MATIRLGSGITDISGGFSGVYFHRDRFGLHCCKKPRSVYRRSAAQQKQRNAFMKARTYSKDQRTLSYLIYRALNGLPFIFDAIVTGNPTPDCKGTYELAGTYNDKDYYKRSDSAYWIWYYPPEDSWAISDALGSWVNFLWNRYKTIRGTYNPAGNASGNPIVKLEIHSQPPPSYNPPGL